ncbi:MAG: hypothetical protein KAJ40_05520 [Alphaproteobacteria bacterium]|nr:hypothetical protein [Alphaproteobacteria bacterium]
MLQQYHRFIFLPCALALGTCFAYLPTAHARNQNTLQPAALHIKITPSKKQNHSMPNIITGRINQSSQNIPLPGYKPQQPDIMGETQKKSKSKALDILHSKTFSTETKIIKTTKETIPFSSLGKTSPDQTKSHNIALPSAYPNYCNEEEQRSTTQASLINPPHTEIPKDKHLVQSLRAYMKAQKRDPSLIDTLYNVTQETGVSFELLVIKAMIESNLGENIVAQNSTARGLFQYIESTWLSLIKSYGGKIGYASYADALKYDLIAKRYVIVSERNNFSRHDILNLRYDTRITTLIKAYQILDEQAAIEKCTKGQVPTITDHYIVHMMGLPLAELFFKLKNSNSTIIPARLKNGMFNNAIAQNPSFFFDKRGNALNAPQIYNRFAETTAQRIDELRAIDTRYGSGENVAAHSCNPKPDRPRIHTRSDNQVKTGLSKNDMEPSAGATAPLPKKGILPHHISSIDILQYEPSLH